MPKHIGEILLSMSEIAPSLPAERKLDERAALLKDKYKENPDVYA
jgi:hypothetical protein